MSAFIDDYQNMIIQQYHDKPKALGDIAVKIKKYEEIKACIDSFLHAFDMDTATGKQLDIIGKIVGIDRFIKDAIPINYFGFSDDPNAKGFGQAPFYKLGDPVYQAQNVGDDTYRFLIKAKIAINGGSAFLSMGKANNLQLIIMFLFNGKAYVVDNYDMTLTLYVDASVDINLLRIAKSLDLIPRAMGTHYRFIIQYDDTVGTFGFSHDASAKGFGLGKFARLLNI